MNEKYKVILSSIIEYIIIGVIFLYVSSAFHEYVHLKVLELLGGEGYIILPLETIIVTSSSNDTLMAMSGGAVTALVLMLIAYLAWRQDYLEMYAACIPLITVQLGYGIYETLFWQLPAEEYWIVGRPVAAISLAIGFIISIYILYKELKARLDYTPIAPYIPS